MRDSLKRPDKPMGQDAEINSSTPWAVFLSGDDEETAGRAAFLAGIECAGPNHNHLYARCHYNAAATEEAVFSYWRC